MKYRIAKEFYSTDYKNNTKYKYYPQHKHWWWPWWHYYGIIDAYSDYVNYDTIDEAKNFINWMKNANFNSEYIDC